MRSRTHVIAQCLPHSCPDPPALLLCNFLLFAKGLCCFCLLPQNPAGTRPLCYTMNFKDTNRVSTAVCQTHTWPSAPSGCCMVPNAHPESAAEPSRTMYGICQAILGCQKQAQFTPVHQYAPDRVTVFKVAALYLQIMLAMRNVQHQSKDCFPEASSNIFEGLKLAALPRPCTVDQPYWRTEHLQ